MDEKLNMFGDLDLPGSLLSFHEKRSSTQVVRGGFTLRLKTLTLRASHITWLRGWHGHLEDYTGGAIQQGVPST